MQTSPVYTIVWAGSAVWGCGSLHSSMPQWLSLYGFTLSINSPVLVWESLHFRQLTARPAQKQLRKTALKQFETKTRPTLPPEIVCTIRNIHWIFFCCKNAICNDYCSTTCRSGCAESCHATGTILEQKIWTRIQHPTATQKQASCNRPIGLLPASLYFASLLEEQKLWCDLQLCSSHAFTLQQWLNQLLLPRWR